MLNRLDAQHEFVNEWAYEWSVWKVNSIRCFVFLKCIHHYAGKIDLHFIYNKNKTLDIDAFHPHVQCHILYRLWHEDLKCLLLIWMLKETRRLSKCALHWKLTVFLGFAMVMVALLLNPLLACLLHHCCGSKKQIYPQLLEHVKQQAVSLTTV